MNYVCVKHDDSKLQNLGNGSTRRVLAYTKELMIVEMTFEEGSSGALHSHPHHQNTYILSGKFRFSVDGDTVEVSEGDSLAFESGVTHGMVCLEKGALLDVFTPMRKEFA